MLNEEVGRQWAQENQGYLREFINQVDSERVVYLWDTAGERHSDAPPQEPVKTDLEIGRCWFNAIVSGFISVDPAGDVVLVEDGESFIKEGPVFAFKVNPYGDAGRDPLTGKPLKEFALGIASRKEGDWNYTEEEAL